AVVERVAKFIELPADQRRLSRAVDRGDFEAMRDVETRFGAEAYAGRAKRSGRFIRRGEPDSWQREMDDTVSERVRRELGRVMTEAGYV
ncbi:MAG: sulfotransferase domain-containing protein, partial [Gemmatimonadota bacterium]